MAKIKRHLPHPTLLELVQLAFAFAIMAMADNGLLFFPLFILIGLAQWDGYRDARKAIGTADDTVWQYGYDQGRRWEDIGYQRGRNDANEEHLNKMRCGPIVVTVKSWEKN